MRAPLPLAPRIARLKERLLGAPYELCLAGARHFTNAYHDHEALDEHEGVPVVSTSARAPSPASHRRAPQA